ncbi:AAA domain protein [Gregarina niphandrodes]|uniref:AAA domain protein n=1 Tax=Gregarina niphandrodes TaxID=110365 RepID=A0A023BE53_GRENI|nr:AAA domain protein [Gregarina niphandrodes]EZG89704.1 AAA domain protein [Gregarina niphandrodes]|eukprot:XP_011128449.1 AAA domain protein [Gregarina niphandrodes]
MTPAASFTVPPPRASLIALLKAISVGKSEHGELEHNRDYDRDADRQLFATGLPRLDAALGGGLASGLLHDVHGAAGLGKTQLAFAVLGETLLRHPTALCVWLHTEGTCAIERLHQMLQSKISGRGLAEEGREAEGARRLLHRVFVKQIRDPEELIKQVQQMEQLDCSVVVIDSVAQLFRYNDRPGNLPPGNVRSGHVSSDRVRPGYAPSVRRPRLEPRLEPQRLRALSPEPAAGDRGRRPGGRCPGCRRPGGRKPGKDSGLTKDVLPAA